MPRIEMDFSHISPRKKVRIQDIFPIPPHFITYFLPYIHWIDFTFHKVILLPNENSELSIDGL